MICLKLQYWAVANEILKMLLSYSESIHFIFNIQFRFGTTLSAADDAVLSFPG